MSESAIESESYDNTTGFRLADADWVRFVKIIGLYLSPLLHVTHIHPRIITHQVTVLSDSQSISSSDVEAHASSVLGSFCITRLAADHVCTLALKGVESRFRPRSLVGDFPFKIVQNAI